MKNVSLHNLRKRRCWNQHQLARRLGVSQTLVSLWEQGERNLPRKHLDRLRKLGMEMNATDLPLREKVNSREMDYGKELSRLGYPGFAHLKCGEASWNPAQLLVSALSEQNLDRRVAEALPWLARRYSEMNWDWVQREARLRNLQNRLGFTLALARKVALQSEEREVAAQLGKQEESLRESLLAKEDTYCHEGMTQAERKWLQARRSPEASAWHVLSDLEAVHLTHA